jgi:hypothetical protein
MQYHDHLIDSTKMQMLQLGSAAGLKVATALISSQILALRSLPRTRRISFSIFAGALTNRPNECFSTRLEVPNLDVNDANQI